jgi:hypothetical protein
VTRRAKATPSRYTGLAGGVLAAVLVRGARSAWDDVAGRLGQEGLPRFLDLYVRQGFSAEAAFDETSCPPAPAPAEIGPSQLTTFPPEWELAAPTPPVKRWPRAADARRERRRVRAGAA